MAENHLKCIVIILITTGGLCHYWNKGIVQLEFIYLLSFTHSFFVTSLYD